MRTAAATQRGDATDRGSTVGGRVESSCRRSARFSMWCAFPARQRGTTSSVKQQLCTGANPQL